MTLLGDCFEVLETLGEGAMGIVYRVRDVRDGTELALKTVPNQDIAQRARLKREFRLSCDLSHRNLVALGELYEHRDTLFFTMELVHGIPVHRHFETHDTSSQALDIIAQLVTAVEALHDAGIVHRDLKPTNILVERGGRLVLLDFGLSRPAPEKSRNELAGTLAYMAPEQMWGYASMASDAYGLGLVVFELLNGHLPSDRLPWSDPSTWSAVKAANFPGWLPVELSTALAGLLDPTPESRTTVRQLRAILLAQPSPPTAPKFGHLMVGREDELDLLISRISRLEPTIVEVFGAPGTGKTTLGRFLCEDLSRLHGFRVASGRCHLRESVPYQAIDEVFERLLEYSASDGLAVDSVTLAPIFPALGPRTVPESTDDAIHAKNNAVAALAELMTSLAASRPLLVWLDDTQWIAPDTAEILVDLVAATSGSQVFWLLTSRPFDGEASPLDALRTSSDFPARYAPHNLAPLTIESANKLLDDLLGPTRPQLSQSDLDRVVHETKGLPLLLHQVAHLIRQRPTQFADLREFGLRELVERRIAHLTEDERRIVELLATSPHPLSETVLLACQHGAHRSQIERLCSAQFLARGTGTGTGSLRIHHESLRTCVVESLDVSKRVDFHDTIASTALRLEPANIDLLFVHLKEAHRTDEALPFGMKIAERAKTTLAFQAEADLYEELLTFAPPDKTHELLAARADALGRAGQNRKAADVYEALSAEGGAVAMRWRLRSVDQYLTAGEMERGLAVLRDALAEAGLKVPSERHLMAGTLVEMVRARVGWLQQRLVRHESADRFELALASAKGLGPINPAASAYFAFLALRLSHRITAGRDVVLALTIAGTIAESVPGPISRWGRSLLLDARRHQRKARLPTISGSVDAWRSQTAVSRGHWTLALRYCDRARRNLRLASDECSSERNLVEMANLRCQEELGHLGEMRSSAKAWRDLAKARGDLYARITADLNLAFLLIVADDPEGSERLATSALEDWPGRVAPFHEFYQSRVVAYAKLYMGDHEGALHMLDRATEVVRRAHLLRMDLVRVDYLLLAARSALLAGSSRHSGLPPIRDTLKRLGREKPDHARAQAAFLRGCLRSMTNDTDDAERELHLARRLFSKEHMALGMAYVDARSAALRGRSEGDPNLDLRLEVANPQRWLRMFVPGYSTRQTDT